MKQYNILLEGIDPKEMFDYIDSFREGFAAIELKYKCYYIDTEGNLYDYETKQPIDAYSVSMAESIRKDFWNRMNKLNEIFHRNGQELID